MLATDTITVAFVEKELAEHEAKSRECRKELKRFLRGAILLFGPSSEQTKKRSAELTELEEHDSRLGRKLRALLAVLKAEQPGTAKVESQDDA